MEGNFLTACTTISLLMNSSFTVYELINSVQDNYRQLGSERTLFEL
jgi:hypothetical protein